MFTLRLAELLTRGGMRVTVTWLPYWAELAPGMLGMTAAPGTDVVHANSWNACAFGSAALPTVVTVHHCVHGPSAMQHTSLMQRLYHRLRIRALERRSLECAAVVTAVSEFTRRSTVSTFGDRPIEVIPNWIDVDAFRPAAVQRPSGPFRLLFTGNWGRRKGTDLLPELMRRLGSRFQLRFTTGRRSGAPTRDLPENMHWAGSVADDAGMVRLYQSCDVVVVPSRLEGFGYAALEAMACGKPVIAFNVASLPEVVEDGVTGRLVGPDDVAAMAAACREFADDPALVRAMGEAARDRAVREFSGARALESYLAVYERALASGR